MRIEKHLPVHSSDLRPYERLINEQLKKLEQLGDALLLGPLTFIPVTIHPYHI
jgi:tRNA A37 threonylcarbamoyladenosine synthetase subunit TsaC/SUA5/YrdC